MNPLIPMSFVANMLMINVVFAVICRPFMPDKVSMSEVRQSSIPTMTVNILFYGLLAIILVFAMLVYGYSAIIAGPFLLLLFLIVFGLSFFVYWMRFHRLNPSSNDKLGFVQTYCVLLLFLLPLGIFTYRLIVS